ncbi:hypothetical protein BDB13_5981 [Rhodococcus sp. OK302]|nr:hypothetical protein BDB13_5981 [Rhodococcus sp. OK302]
MVPRNEIREVRCRFSEDLSNHVDASAQQKSRLQPAFNVGAGWHTSTGSRKIPGAKLHKAGMSTGTSEVSAATLTRTSIKLNTPSIHVDWLTGRELGLIEQSSNDGCQARAIDR